MALTLRDLKAETRELTIQIAGGELTLAYRPAEFTPALEEMLTSPDGSVAQSRRLAQALSILVASWDLLDDDGVPYPLTESALLALPTAAFLSPVVTAILEDLSVPKPRKTASGSFS